MMQMYLFHNILTSLLFDLLHFFKFGTKHLKVKHFCWEMTKKQKTV